MNEARDIARSLGTDTDLSAAALLVALGQCGNVDVLKEDLPVLTELEDLGLIANGEITKLGRQVAIRLLMLGVGW